MRHYVDVHVGKRIRYARWVANVTQQQLAEQVGIRFQQIQKYETGTNRVSASRLYDIAQSLGVAPAYFFEDIDQGADGAPATSAIESVATASLRAVPKGATASLAMFSDRDALEFVRNYYALSDEPRRRLFDLTKSLADAA